MTENHENRIRQLPCWKGEISLVPLDGGMTNLNFRVENDNESYVVRLGDDVPEHLVLRENEGISSEAAAQCGFSPEVIHRETGVLVIRFIHGKVFGEDDVRDADNLSRLVGLLKNFHSQMPQALGGYPILFWVFQVIRHYENMLTRGNSNYLKQVPELIRIARGLEQDVGPIDLVYGHNDLLPANFIDDGKKIWLIDFDYAGFNSPLFDLSNLASNSQFEETAERNLLHFYYGYEPDDQKWKSYNAMKCASLLRETMWSMVSEIYSKIDFDYTVYTRENNERFERAYAEYRKNFG